jgi:hypothetical protein
MFFRFLPHCATVELRKPLIVIALGESQSDYIIGIITSTDVK